MRDATEGLRMPKPTAHQVAAIYIGNLSYESNELSLRDHLTFLGLEVISTRVVFNRETGAPRGFAFADVVGDLNPVIELVNGTRLDGRSLRVSAAIRRE